MKTVLIALLVASFLVGCCPANRKGLLSAGYSEHYVDGYLDGYSAGSRVAGHPFYQFTRDLGRYERDHQYTKGWDDGFTIARGEYIAVR
ncbi:MAG: hypothetical protein MUC88_12380 [Planctomycetes bacterium]|jgi:hypothetical protein|nr:hypothetical protein [Planctomycetota bacterium]